MEHSFQFCTAILADETIDLPDAAPQEPQDGETYFTSWSELVYEMTHGAMGTPPKPPKQPPPQKR